MFIAIDIGNNIINLALFKGDEIRTQLKFASDSTLLDMKAHLESLVPYLTTKSNCYIASVNREAALNLSTCIDKHFNAQIAGVIDIKVEDITGIKNNYQTQATLGIDRLINGLAALRLYLNTSVKSACYVLDIGTAVTIDLISKEQGFEGGLIAPGMQILLDSLHSSTSQLPNLKFTMQELTYPGKTTDESILLGARMCIEGLITQTITSNIDIDNLIIFTGGLGKCFGTHTELTANTEIIIDPHLTLKGINEFIKLKGAS